MPAEAKGTVATTRLRKAECYQCGYIIRVSRAWIERGLPSCACGAGEMNCSDIADRCHLPGEAGEEAYGIVIQAIDDFARRSENARKAMRVRRRCKDKRCGRLIRGEDLYCQVHASQGMPF